MTNSKACWTNNHFACKYIGCYCDCHSKESEMYRNLERVKELNVQLKKEKQFLNPFTTKAQPKKKLKNQLKPALLAELI